MFTQVLVNKNTLNLFKVKIVITIKIVKINLNMNKSNKIVYFASKII